MSQVPDPVAPTASDAPAAPVVPVHRAAPVAGPGAVAKSSRASVDTFRGFALELVIVTAGVLIALSVDSLREWSQTRSLVRQARETIAREVADNKADLDATLAGLTKQRGEIAKALQLAGDLLAKRESPIRSLNIGAELADLTDSGWRSAERMGALSHMDFSAVQRYSRVYELQELFVAHQRQSVERAAGAIAILGGGDPHGASDKDLELFRQNMLMMSGDLIITEGLAKRLSEGYAALLATR
jgi:hypothetical protein